MPDSTFDDFVAASLPQLSRYAYALTGASADGDDLVQDTLVKLARAWRRVRREGNPVAYARTIMMNTYISGWRTLVRRPRSVPLTDFKTIPDVYPVIDDRDLLDRALAALPRDQRAVLVLGYLDDLSDHDIAAILGRKLATVRSLRHRALTALRADLTAKEDAHGRA